jgi:hypothetical protein
MGLSGCPDMVPILRGEGGGEHNICHASLDYRIG